MMAKDRMGSAFCSWESIPPNLCKVGKSKCCRHMLVKCVAGSEPSACRIELAARIMKMIEKLFAHLQRFQLFALGCAISKWLLACLWQITSWAAETSGS